MGLRERKSHRQGKPKGSLPPLDTLLAESGAGSPGFATPVATSPARLRTSSQAAAGEQRAQTQHDVLGTYQEPAFLSHTSRDKGQVQ